MARRDLVDHFPAAGPGAAPRAGTAQRAPPSSVGRYHHHHPTSHPVAQEREDPDARSWGWTFHCVAPRLAWPRPASRHAARPDRLSRLQEPGRGAWQPA